MKKFRLAGTGILPGMDIAGQMNPLLLQNPRNVEFHFAPGVYHLYPQSAAAFSASLSNFDQLPVLKAGLLLSNMHHARLVGHGATLL